MKPYYSEDGVSIFHGDCREILPALPGPGLNCCVTSPPYFGLRYYGGTVPTGEGEGDHTATFPVELITPCILAGCPPGGTVLDPFCGTGTTLLVAKENGCGAIGIEIEEKYCEIAAKRLAQKVLNFEPAAARSSQ